MIRKLLRAEIITIGEELLIGQVIDSNSAFIAKELNTVGVEVRRMVSVSDDSKQISDAITESKKYVNFIFLTGGLGPTRDDITKEALCHYFNDYLIEDPTTLKNIKKKLGCLDVRALNINKRQAQILSSAQALKNEVGIAPGMWVERKGYILISLPGVPNEAKHILTNVVIPKIQRQYDGSYILHKTVDVYKTPESKLSDLLSDFEKMLPVNFTLAYLPSPGKVILRLSGKGFKKKEVESTMETLTNSLSHILKSNIRPAEDMKKTLLKKNGR